MATFNSSRQVQHLDVSFHPSAELFQQKCFHEHVNETIEESSNLQKNINQKKNVLHSSVFPCLTIGKPSNSGCHISIFLKPTRVATLQPHGNTEIQLQGLEFRVATAIVLSFRAEKFVIGHRLGGLKPPGSNWRMVGNFRNFDEKKMEKKM